MKRTLYAAAAAILAASLVVAHAQTSSTSAPAKKHVPAKKAVKPSEPSVADQIQALRTEMQTQIDSLRSDLTAKDAQLRQAQQDAADAHAAANKAEADAQAQQQTFTQNTDAVTTLQSTVSDLKTNQLSLATTVSDETTTLKKAIGSPDAINYKGVTISPAGSFIEAATVWRQGATGDDINTGASSVPLQNADGAGMSEFFGSARQSRVALKFSGKIASMTMTGYYEADWLSSGTTSNNNQSNSYTMRQRELWADAKTPSGWDFSGGTGWSLAAETASGLTRGTQILPATIDAQYDAGFVWARQESFRVVKNIGTKTWVGLSAENPQLLNAAGQNIPSNYLIGSTGTGGGLYDNQANYSFNMAPDLIAKIAVEPGWGHWEAFGIGRFYRDRIYPTTGSPYNDMEPAGGIGGGFRGPFANKKVTIGLKGLYGYGVGRYGNTTLSDVTNDANGELKPIHNGSALFTLEATPTPRLLIYLNYGGDYAARADYATSALTLSDPTATFCQTGVTAANASTFCSAKPTAAMFATGGSWGSHFTAAPAIIPIGYGSRYASVSATCAVAANPGLVDFTSIEELGADAVVVQVAIPPVIAWLVHPLMPLPLKATVPVGVAPAPVMVAVKVTDCP